jgi:hypothetical protein
MKHENLYPTITPEQHEALHAFAQQHGRTWKRHLCRLWEKASAPRLLHALRNTHGPRWLMRYRPWPDAARKR